MFNRGAELFRKVLTCLQVKLHEFMEGTQQQKSFFVELWDVGGSHSQRNTRHVFFHTVHGIILVHDLANRKSCHNLGRWLAEVSCLWTCDVLLKLVLLYFDVDDGRALSLGRIGSSSSAFQVLTVTPTSR